jgi:hypothetical protein
MRASTAASPQALPAYRRGADASCVAAGQAQPSTAARSGEPPDKTAQPKKKGPSAANAGGPGSNQNTNLIFCQSSDLCNQAIDPPGLIPKRFATLQALLALRGFALTKASVGDGLSCFHITRWNRAHSVATLDEVAAFAHRVGVNRG